MPVRKLPAYLASINPNKVRPELREKIILYQNECDDALWNYWMKGQQQAKDPEPIPSSQTILDHMETLAKELQDFVKSARENARKYDNERALVRHALQATKERLDHSAEVLSNVLRDSPLLELLKNG